MEYPLGHRRRRVEAIPLLEQKFVNNISTHFKDEQKAHIVALCKNAEKLNAIPVNEFMDLWCKKN